jgi:hypothetical protein
MTRRTMFIHIGLHKTGTTSIQQCLTESSYQLHQVGMLYPISGRHPLAVTQHALLAKAFDPTTPFEGTFALTGPIDAEIVLAALLHEIELSGLDTIIISSEELLRLTAEQVAEVGKAFNDYDIYPIAFIRNFPVMFDSLYSTLMQYTKHTFVPSDDLIGTDLYASFQAWSTISADGKIRVLDFDASPTRNTVLDFLDVVGIDAGKINASSRECRLNQSLPPAHVAMIRELRCLGIDEDATTELLAQLGGLSLPERQTNLPDALRDILASKYAEQRRLLCEADFVTGLLPASVVPVESEPPIYMGGLPDVLFAIGRGIGRQ